jgi:hypothetical protein
MPMVRFHNQKLLKMRKILFFLFILLSNLAPAQDILVSGKDTLICFTPEQSKFILKQVLELEFCQEEKKIDSLIIQKQDSLVSNLTNTVSLQKDIINNCDQVVVVKNIEIKVLKEELNDCNKAYRKQKRRTHASLIGGGILAGILTVLIFAF